MELLQAINERRSCRAFTDESVSRETIDEIISAGCAAPSALNQQPWSFTVVTNPDKIDEIAQKCVETRDKLAETSQKGWVAKYDMGFITAAKALIVIAADPDKIGMGAYLDEKDAHIKAASACIQNMLLMTTAKGLGSIWFTMYDKDHLHDFLEIPTNLEIAGMLPLGVPAGEMRPVPRRDHKELSRYLD